MITTKVVFDHRCRAGDGAGPIEVRITVDRKSYYIATGEKCLAYDFRDGRVRDSAKSGNADIINERVRIVREKVERIVNDMLEHEVEIDAAEIRRQITVARETAKASKTEFADWCEGEVLKLNIKSGTRKHYKALIRRLHEYRELSSWDSLTTEGIYRWDSWLHGIKVGEDYISDSGVWNYHKNLKTLLNRAQLFGLIQVNPYDRLRGKFRRGERENMEYLTEEEMQAFCLLDIKDGVLRTAKDLFVFQMYTGMAYSDAQRFDIGQYKQMDGRWVNVGERVKTGVAYISELLPPVVEVLERNGWRVPRMDNADYNHALKLLGQAAGISTPLHSHLARHTFATWMLRNGAKIENVSRMLGHTNITQTQRYCKILAQSVHDDFEKVRLKMNGQRG